MRVLMLDNEFPPLGGGTGVVNYHLLEQFAAYPEVQVDLVTSSRSRASYEREQFAERIAIYKVPVDNRNIHHSTNAELLRYSWRGMLTAHKLARRQPYDLSFAFAGVPAGVLSYTLRALTGLPYIVSLQGPDVPGFEARYNYLYPFLKPILRQVWRHAGAVTAISEAHRDLALQLMPNLEIPVIYNGVDDRAFSPASPATSSPATSSPSTSSPSTSSPSTSSPSTSSGAGAGAGAINILCVGRLIERKGQQHLLRAFAALCAHRPEPLFLTLVGTGDGEPALRTLAAELGLADMVRFTGFVPREEMPAVYREAHLFALPSQNEGMSIALLEALAAGLPVLVTDTGGTAELVREGLNGLIVPWADISALSAALSRLLDQRERWSAMGAASREVAARFRWEAVARDYLDLCARIARSAAPAPATLAESKSTPGR